MTDILCYYYAIPRRICAVISMLYRRTSCKVRVYGDETEEFDVKTGVRQGSILSPTLFNTVICWVLDQVFENDRHPEIQIGPGRGKITDLAFADDIALIGESEADVQKALYDLSRVAGSVGLEINASKTKIVKCCASTNAHVALEGDQLEEVNRFKYLGSEVDGRGASGSDIQHRVALAQFAYNNLHQKVFRSRCDISTTTKVRIYSACIRSILLYGAESWQLTETDIKRLEVFEHRCWRRCLRVSYRDRVSNVEVRARFGNIPELRSRLTVCKLKWFGHVLRMHDRRVAKQSLFFQPPSSWKRPAGGVYKTWNRSIIDILCDHIKPPHVKKQKWRSWRQDCETVAQNRNQWRALIRDVTNSVA